MKKEFDFNRIGKRMPYTTPEGFLDNLEKHVWEQVKDEVKPSKPKRNYSLWYFISGGLVAASVTLLLVFNILPGHQDYLLTVYQDDLFMNQ